MDNLSKMKTLMEAVDKVKAPKVDQPFKSFKNTPNEQTTDSKTMQDGGNDLHRKKNAQFRSNEGDNPMAMTPVKVKQVQEALQRKFNKFKINEGDKSASKKKVDESIGKESKTLRSLHMRDKGKNSSDKIQAKVFGPNEQFPAPWAYTVNRPMPICTLEAANGEDIAGWLTKDQCEAILAEVDPSSSKNQNSSEYEAMYGDEDRNWRS